jgi:hypothetical protein
MDSIKKLETYAQELAGYDNLWDWEVDIPPLEPVGPFAEFSEDCRVAEINWTQDDTTVMASISKLGSSPDSWFTIASITRGDDCVRAEFHSKDSALSGLKAALSDPEPLLGPFRSRLIDKIRQLTNGRFQIERELTRWSTISCVSMRKDSIRADISNFRGNWSLTVIESEPIVEDGAIIDYETLNRADLSFDDEEEMLDAVEQWVADTKVFFRDSE